MIKRLYLVNGNLTQPLDINEENIAVDANTATKLNILNIGDWCYLTLIEGNKLEVIKITKFPSWYWVDRGQDNTSQCSFSTQAKIIYLLTAQEIEDAVNGTPLSIYPNGYGALEVNTGVNSWQINYTELSIQTLGGISWMNPDGYEVVITDNNGMFGCCDGSLTGAPYPGGTFFYLTSQLYSLLYEEIGPNNDPYGSNKHTGSPPLSSVWLLQQPSIIDWMGNAIQVPNVYMYGAAIVYTYNEQYVEPYITMQSMNQFGGAVVTDVNDQYIIPDSYVLVANLFGSAVVYNNYLDTYINPSIVLQNATLQ